MSGDIIHSSRTDIYPARSSHVVDPIFVLDGENTNTVQGPLVRTTVPSPTMARIRRKFTQAR
jgi:hypothetical protein